MTRHPYRVHSEDTWAKARDAYLGGEPASSVCRRFHLGLSAFRKRAAAQGWRRSDQDTPSPLSWVEIEDLPDLGPREAADLAYHLIHQAMVNDRPRDANAWLTVYLGFTRDIAASEAFHQFHRGYYAKADEPTRKPAPNPLNPP